MTEQEHRTRVEVVPEGFQMLCSCGFIGRVRPKRADCGEDEIAHEHTGAGPRTLDQIRDAEERESYIGKVQVLITKAIRPRGSG